MFVDYSFPTGLMKDKSGESYCSTFLNMKPRIPSLKLSIEEEEEPREPPSLP